MPERAEACAAAANGGAIGAPVCVDLKSGPVAIENGRVPVEIRI